MIEITVRAALTALVLSLGSAVPAGAEPLDDAGLAGTYRIQVVGPTGGTAGAELPSPAPGTGDWQVFENNPVGMAAVQETLVESAADLEAEYVETDAPETDSAEPDSAESDTAEPDSSVVFGALIASEARRYLGYQYRYGGASEAGFDCSGLVYYHFRQHGIDLPRDSWGQATVGVAVERSELQPGDIVVFANTYTAGISHVGIYTGDGKFIHAVDESTGVLESDLNSSYWQQHYYGARRVTME